MATGIANGEETHILLDMWKSTTGFQRITEFKKRTKQLFLSKLNSLHRGLKHSIFPLFPNTLGTHLII